MISRTPDVELFLSSAHEVKDSTHGLFPRLAPCLLRSREEVLGHVVIEEFPCSIVFG